MRIGWGVCGERVVSKKSKQYKKRDKGITLECTIKSIDKNSDLKRFNYLTSSII